MIISEYFSRHEFACRCGCGFDVVDAELLSVLEFVRDHFNRPVAVTSGCRCRKHNTKVGGSKNSKHRIGKAADIRVVGIRSSDVATYLEDEFSGTYGIGRYSSWTHIDVRKNKTRWGK